MDDATLLELEALKVEALAWSVEAQTDDQKAAELILRRAHRIRALGKQGGYPIDPDGKVRPERVDCGDMVEHRTAPIDDLSDQVVPGSRKRWELERYTPVVDARANTGAGMLHTEDGSGCWYHRGEVDDFISMKLSWLGRLLAKTLPELPPDLEQEVANALKAIGAR